MKVYVTIVVEPDDLHGYQSDVRDRFIIEGGTAPTNEICENVTLAAYNMTEELVEKARAKSG